MLLKFSLIVSKTDLIVFKPKRKPLDFNMNIKLHGKILYPTDSLKYLGVKNDIKLNWTRHVNATATKLNPANAMLVIVRHLSMQIFLNQYIMHYLKHTLTMLASYVHHHMGTKYQYK